MWLVVARDVVTVVGVAFRWLFPFGVTATAMTWSVRLCAHRCTGGTAATWWLQIKMKAKLGDASAGPTARAIREKEEMREERS